MIDHDGVAPVAWDEARRRAGAVASGTGIIEVSLADAIGLVLAQDMVARQAIPHFASSAMDGWAVVGGEPWTLGVEDMLRPGSAWPVVTGQNIPPGVHGVLRSENGEVLDGLLVVNDRATAGDLAVGRHVRPVGSEAAEGDVVVTAGCVITPAHVALAAGCALDRLSVYRRPRVSILLTGDEVVCAGVPAAGQVRDSFGPQLPAVLRMLGAAVESTGRVSDNLDATVSSLATAATHAQIVVTTGGTGYSPVDHVRSALEALGATMLIGSIALRPGGPTMLARLPDGQFVVCLPGNPLAAVMGLLTVGAPLIDAVGGRPRARRHQVELAADVAGVPSATQLIPYSLTGGRATTTAWRGSAMMRGLASADGVLVVPSGGAAAGSQVESLPLPW